jgi:hypothetical protein
MGCRLTVSYASGKESAAIYDTKDEGQRSTLKLPAVDQEVVRAQRIVAEALENEDLAMYYSLEFKDLYPSHLTPSRKGVANTIVYSLNGKSSYTSTDRNEGGVSFGMKDLQKLLGSTAQRGRGKEFWWRFGNAAEKIAPYYTPKDRADLTLVFESRFESGNLGLAIKLSDNEYRLVLQNDSLTKGNTQCKGAIFTKSRLGFNFKVSNTRKGAATTFHIVNYVRAENPHSNSF